MRLIKYVLDGIGLDALVRSRRMMGFARTQVSLLGLRRQATAFTPVQVAQLEEIAGDLEEGSILRGVAYGILFLICFRGRFMDLEHILKLEVEDDIVIAKVSKTKTSNRDKSRLPLHLVGPRYLFGGTDWVSGWEEFREAQGIPGNWPMVPSHDGEHWLSLIHI